MKNTELSQFSLKKVKQKGNGLEVSFEVTESTSVEVYHDEKQIKSERAPHPDLTDLLQGQKENLAAVFYFGKFKEVLRNPDFKPTEKQKELMEAQFDEILTKIKVTGVSLSGVDDNKGIIITGTIKTETGQVVAINTQRIKYTGETYGFEEELEDAMEALESEVFEYVVKGKTAQLEMAFNEEDADEMEAALQEEEIED